jgi:hypothetical protein
MGNSESKMVVEPEPERKLAKLGRVNVVETLHSSNSLKTRRKEWRRERNSMRQMATTFSSTPLHMVMGGIMEMIRARTITSLLRTTKIIRIRRTRCTTLEGACMAGLRCTVILVGATVAAAMAPGGFRIHIILTT